MIRALIIICLFIRTQIVFCQQGSNTDRLAIPRIIPPSSESASLGKYADVPVNLYTGVPSISIPIWTLQSRELSVPISLDYHASGIKVDEVASNVGLGWSLNAGGSISVSVMGHPDGVVPFQRVPFPEELVRDLDQDGIEDFTSLYYTYGQSVTSGIVDTEPDVYYYSFPGKSGKFVFNHEQTARTIPYQPFVINRNQISGRIIIVDESGNEYTFDPGESVEVRSKQLMKGNLPSNFTPPPVVNSASTYFLSKIKSPSKDSIVFIYESYSYSYKSSVHESDYTILPQPNCNSSDVPLQELWERTSFITSKRVKEIRGLNGISAIFTYANSSRLDVRVPLTGSPNGELLSITIKNGFNQTLKNFQLTYDYFKSSAFSSVSPELKDLHCKLKLLKCTEEGKPPYSFEYASTTSFPERFSYSQDHWGYYNGKPSNGALPQVTYGGLIINGADKAPDLSFMRIGTIASITYPTGGKTEFEFEPHNYATTSSTFSWPDPITQGIGISVSSDPNAPNTAMNNFTIPSNVVRCDGTDSNKAKVTIAMNNSNDDAFQSSGIAGLASSSILGPQNIQLISTGIRTFEGCLPIGNYQGNASFSGILDPNSGEIPAWSNISVTWYQLPQSNTTVSNVSIGGLRIKKIIDRDISNAVIKEKNYRYEIPGTNQSSGILANPPQVGVISQVTKLVNIDNTSVPVTCTYLMRESQSSMPLGAIKGSNVAYEFVTVSEGQNDSNGFVIHQYSNFKNIQPETVSPLVPSTDNDWIRGLLLNKVTVKKNGTELDTLQIEESIYQLFNAPSDFWGYRSVATTPVLINSDGVTTPPDDAPFTITTTGPGFNIESNTLCMRLEESFKLSSNIASSVTYYKYAYYKYVSAHFQLFKTRLKSFSSNGASQVTEQRYYYDNYRHLMPTRIASDRSDGTTELVIKKYPFDYTYNDQAAVSNEFVQAIVRMQQSNQLTSPIETQQWLKQNSSFRFKNSELNTYTSTPQGVKLTATFSMPNLTNQSFTNSSITTGNEFLMDPSYVQDISSVKYSDTGLITDYTDRTGVNVSFLYSYFNSLPVAKAINSKSTDIFHTSFEDINEGNSQLGDSKLGDRSKTDGFNKGLSNLTNGKYTLSYWRKVSNDWVPVSESITVSLGTYTIDLSGHIDDIRFYPESARMETYTHKVGVGITSVTKPDNLSEFYIYDDYGRLKMILNHERKVIKSIDYQYYKP